MIFFKFLLRVLRAATLEFGVIWNSHSLWMTCDGGKVGLILSGVLYSRRPCVQQGWKYSSEQFALPLMLPGVQKNLSS